MSISPLSFKGSTYIPKDQYYKGEDVDYGKFYQIKYMVGSKGPLLFDGPTTNHGYLMQTDSFLKDREIIDYLLINKFGFEYSPEKEKSKLPKHWEA